MANYVYSTLSNDQVYTSYKAGPNGVNLADAKIFIAGQANITTKHFVTPLGMVTEVTDEQLAILRTNEVFKLHEANGFIKVEKRKTDADVAAADMQGRDQSAPLVEQDFKEDEAPVTNKRSRKSKG